MLLSHCSRPFLGIMFLVILSGASSAFAAEPQTLNAGDTAWLLISSALVLLMLPGLALFYGGMVQKKNVLSSLMHSFVALCIVGLEWIVIGYSLSFGEGNGFIGDMSQFFLSSTNVDSLTGTVPTYAYIMFQGMFAIITPALISGAIAERMKFSTYVVFILLWSVVIYNPLAHWFWGGGWLSKIGALDFAGGVVVHLSSGVSALAMVQLLGKRKGYPSEMFVPHNLTMTLLGAGLLWFGWFGFNAGSAQAANGNAALAFTTSMVAASAAGTSWMLMEWSTIQRPSALGLASGIVAGLASVTPAAGFITPGWAVLVGLVAGVICFYGVRLKFKFGFDDSLDVVGVHGVGGIWGPLATGLFASVGSKGLIAGNPNQLAIQLLGLVSAGAYAYFLTLLMGWMLDKTMGLRVTEEEESAGLDKELHGETGYNY